MQDEFDPSELPPSKSQLKRDAAALRALGADLLDVPEDDWFELGLPDELIAALREAKKIRSHGARKRQLGFIGKLMRDLDPEPIYLFLEQKRLKLRQQSRQHHQLEDWRDRLIAEGDAAVEAYLQEYTDADRQHLRQLVRQARKESEQNRPPKSSRALFRYLREQQD